MKLLFRINSNYLLLHAINQSRFIFPFEEWNDLVLDIWRKSKESFYFLGGYPETVLYLNQLSDFKKLSEKTTRILNQIKKTKEFKRLLKETKKYKQFVEKQWKKNERKVFHILEGLLGVKIPRNVIYVYLTHPKLKNGKAIDKNIIVWGHYEEFLNYSTIYLCHEIMHLLTNLDRSRITHAVIELMINNELRIQLNKKGRYFQFPGHKDLEKLERKILPRWKKYLKSPKKNFFDFLQNLKESLKKKRYVF